MEKNPTHIEAATAADKPEHQEKVAALANQLKELRGQNKSETKSADNAAREGQSDFEAQQTSLAQKEQLETMQADLQAQKEELSSQTTAYQGTQEGHAGELQNTASESQNVQNEATKLAQELEDTDPENAEAAEKIASDAGKNSKESTSNSRTITSGTGEVVANNTDAGTQVETAVGDTGKAKDSTNA